MLPEIGIVFGLWTVIRSGNVVLPQGGCLMVTAGVPPAGAEASTIGTITEAVKKGGAT